MPLSMVGRADELAELVAAWAHLAAGPGPRTAVVTAGAGAGKSLLVAAALEAFNPAPSVVLFGAARIHTPAPYDWLAAVLSTHDTSRVPVPPAALAWLAQQPGPEFRYAPGALLRLAVRTVRALAGAGPAAIVVEDLHSLDPASLNLVAELAAAPRLPALLLVASRPPEEAESPQLVAKTLARLAGVPRAVRQHLGPLRPDEVATLLDQVYGEPVPEEVAVAVHQRTGGNPYCLTELLASGRHADPGTLVSHPLPAHLRRLAEDGAAELTAREVEVLSCLAAGMSNKQVARSLGISIRTVTVHVSNLLRKTRSSSRTEAAMWAVRHQLTGPRA
jgi:DNA-binding CsgD family transcriptional regulator/predicted ATPase